MMSPPLPPAPTSAANSSAPPKLAFSFGSKTTSSRSLTSNSPSSSRTDPTSSATSSSTTTTSNGIPFTALRYTAPSSLGKRPRPNDTRISHSALGHFSRGDSDHDSEDDNDGLRRGGAEEAVTGFEGGRVVTAESKSAKGPLVIPAMRNTDFRTRAKERRGKNLLPAEVQAARRGEADRMGGNGNGVDVVNAPGDEPKWGLSISKRSVVSESADTTREEITMTDAGVTVSKVEAAAEARTQPEPEPVPDKSDDKKAIDALMGITEARGRPALIIPIIPDLSPALEGISTSTPHTTNGSHRPQRADDPDDAYRRAIALAPDVSTLADYEAVPVEEFGAALLRGMGWKGPDSESDKGRVRAKDVQRRPNRLGLGAKELKGVEELGAWGNGSKGRKKIERPAEYNRRRELEREGRDRDRERREGREERNGASASGRSSGYSRDERLDERGGGGGGSGYRDRRY